MAYHEWLSALLIACSLGRMGALPKTVPLEAGIPYVQQGVPIRVGIAQHAQAVKVVVAGRATVTMDADGASSSGTLRRGDSLWARPDGDRILVEAAGRTARCQMVTLRTPRAHLRVYSWGASSRRGVYRGDLEVVPDDNGTLSAVNVLPLERYLTGVVPAEVPASFHAEALKAQAIIARTWAVHNLGKHSRQGFDLCDGMHCQQYRGAAGTSRVRAAVAATAGQVLAYRGALVETVYHAVCGGYVDDPHRVWKGYLVPYLRATADRPGGGYVSGDDADEEQVARLLAETSSSYCAGGPRYRWRRSFSAAEAQRLLDANLSLLTAVSGAPGRLIDMRAESRSPGGRVQRLRIVTDRAEYEVKRDHIRWLFGDGKAGPNGLPSTLFRLHVERDARGKPSGFVFDGAGWGHGLGLCQYGANGRARAGAWARGILQAYYPGAEVIDLSTVRYARPEREQSP